MLAVVLDDPQTGLADNLLKAGRDDAPKTRSELKFRVRDGLWENFVDPATGKHPGLDLW
jgi:hypothetical protein